jgi:cell division GTPase FtsZ
MNINFKKTKNRFTASMLFESNLETNNEENLKRINTSFIKEFVKNRGLLTKKETTVDLEKRKPLLVGFAFATGYNRAKKVIELALSTLLFNDSIIVNANSILLLISSHIIEINIDEIGEINDYIQEKTKNKADITMLVSEDKNLSEALAITIILSEIELPKKR